MKTPRCADDVTSACCRFAHVAFWQNASTCFRGSCATVSTGPEGDLRVDGLSEAAVGDAALNAGIAVHRLHTEFPDLEDAFLELTGRDIPFAPAAVHVIDL